MINKLWFILVVIGLIFGIVNNNDIGRISNIVKAIIISMIIKNIFRIIIMVPIA